MNRKYLTFTYDCAQFLCVYRISVPIPTFAHLMIEVLCLLFLVALFQVLLSTSLAPALYSSEKSKGNLS